MSVTETGDSRDILQAAIEAGEILLENGAETYRVDETMHRICRAYGIESEGVFVLSNGLFLTAGNEHDRRFARVKYIPVRNYQLNRVEAVNKLSREIVEGKYSVAEVREELKRIRNMKGPDRYQYILAAAVSSGTFCHLFGGEFYDMVCAFFIGLVLGFYMLRKQHFSKFVENMVGGMLISAIALAAIHLPFGISLSTVISGSIMPLVPGVAFVTGIRDMTNSDYLSGMVRLLDAILIFAAIAVGVGIVIGLGNLWIGRFGL